MRHIPAAYYEKGEERFGWFMSIGYLLFTKFGALNALVKFAASDIRKSNAKNILDIGTGVGELPLRLSADKKLRVYAVDPSEAMVRIAKSRNKNSANVTVVRGSSRHIPFNRNFDLIISTLSFHHWKHREKALRYMKEFLGRHGEIWIYEYNKDRLKAHEKIASAHSMSRREFIEIAKGSGMKVRIATSGEFIKAVFT